MSLLLLSLAFVSHWIVVARRVRTIFNEPDIAALLSDDSEMSWNVRQRPNHGKGSDFRTRHQVLVREVLDLRARLIALSVEELPENDWVKPVVSLSAFVVHGVPTKRVQLRCVARILNTV